MKRAPKRLRTTAQAIRGGILIGLGIGIGSVINGLIYQDYGSTTMYLVTGVLALGGFLFGMVSYTLVRCRAINGREKS